MKSETFLDFCFIREVSGELKLEVDEMLSELFKGQRLHWYLDAKVEKGVEIIVAEVKGMSRFLSEQEVIDYIEDHAVEKFWTALQGYQFAVYPAKKGCGTCG